MVRAEPRNDHTPAMDTNHSTMFTLLPELNVIYEQRWIGHSSNSKIVPEECFIWWQNMHYHIANLWNQITTKIFHIFRIITLKQEKLSQSDPVLIHQFSKKLQSDPVQVYLN